jgi:hypothetical protein
MSKKGKLIISKQNKNKTMFTKITLKTKLCSTLVWSSAISSTIKQSLIIFQEWNNSLSSSLLLLLSRFYTFLKCHHLQLSCSWLWRNLRWLDNRAVSGCWLAWGQCKERNFFDSIIITRAEKTFHHCFICFPAISNKAVVERAKELSDKATRA